MSRVITIKHTGDFNKKIKMLSKITRTSFRPILEKYAKEGVVALQLTTPKRTGYTSSCWFYEIEQVSDGWVIHWNNSNVVKGENIALLLQVGHGTRRGGYVRGIDYINPALQPVFDRIAKNAWEEVSSIAK